MNGPHMGTTYDSHERYRIHSGKRLSCGLSPETAINKLRHTKQQVPYRLNRMYK
jgi:hypothetical protein